MDDVYTVPLSTFWRPVELGEYVEDPLQVKEFNQKNSKVISHFNENDMLENFGKLLPAALREGAENDPEYQERIA